MVLYVFDAGKMTTGMQLDGLWKATVYISQKNQLFSNEKVRTLATALGFTQLPEDKDHSKCLLELVIWINQLKPEKEKRIQYHYI